MFASKKTQKSSLRECQRKKNSKNINLVVSHPNGCMKASEAASMRLVNCVSTNMSRGQRKPAIQEFLFSSFLHLKIFVLVNSKIVLQILSKGQEMLKVHFKTLRL